MEIVECGMHARLVFVAFLSMRYRLQLKCNKKGLSEQISVWEMAEQLLHLITWI